MLPAKSHARRSATCSKPGFSGRGARQYCSSLAADAGKPQDGEKHGWRVQAEGGRLSPPAPIALARGTTVEMHDLYFNTPARRKFLKTEATEFSYCDETFKRIAFSRRRHRLHPATQRHQYAAICMRQMYEPASERYWAMNSARPRYLSRNTQPICGYGAWQRCPPIRDLPATPNIFLSMAASCATS